MERCLMLTRRNPKAKWFDNDQSHWNVRLCWHKQATTTISNYDSILILI